MKNENKGLRYVNQNFYLVFQDKRGTIVQKVRMEKEKARELMGALDALLCDFPGYEHGINYIITDYGTVTIIRRKDFKWLNDDLTDDDEDEDDGGVGDFNPLFDYLNNNFKKKPSLREAMKEKGLISSGNGKEAEPKSK